MPWCQSVKKRYISYQSIIIKNCIWIKNLYEPSDSLKCFHQISLIKNKLQTRNVERNILTDF